MHVSFKTKRAFQFQKHDPASEVLKFIAPIPLLPCRILIVEDDTANLMVATFLLEMFGYQFDVARSGKEAIDKAKTGIYRIVMLDIRMNDMNGQEVARIIRSYESQNNGKPVQILCVTACVMLGEREQCLAAGMDDYLAKPYKAEELKQKLELLVRQNE